MNEHPLMALAAGGEGLDPAMAEQAAAPADGGGREALAGREETVAIAAKIVRELINEIGLDGVMQMLQEMGSEAGIDTSAIASIQAGAEAPEV